MSKLTFGPKRHALVTFNKRKRKLDFLCDNKGVIHWFGPLHEIYTFMLPELLKDLDAYKNTFAIDADTYANNQWQIHYASQTPGSVPDVEDFIFSLMRRVDLRDDAIAYAAMVPVSCYVERVRESMHKATPEQVRNISRKLSAFLTSTERAECFSCGQLCIKPQTSEVCAQHQALADFIDNPELAHCIACASLMICDKAEVKNAVVPTAGFVDKLNDIRATIGNGDLKAAGLKLLEIQQQIKDIIKASRKAAQNSKYGKGKAVNSAPADLQNKPWLN